MYRVILNGKTIEHDFKKEDRVRLKGPENETGTVKAVIHNGLFIEVKWDDQCRDRMGSTWLPTSLIKF